MIRKRKESNPYRSLSEILMRFDFVEELYPEMEVHTELLPVSIPELSRVSEPFTGTDLGDCLNELEVFLEELQNRRCLDAYEIKTAYLLKEQALFLCLQETSSLSEIPNEQLFLHYNTRLESVKRANYMARLAYDRAGSYRRQMQGKRLIKQTELFTTALREEIKKKGMKKGNEQE